MQELEDPSLHECGGIFVVVREAAVREQMPVTRIEEQLRPLDRCHEVARGGEILIHPRVVFHHVDLQPDPLGPRTRRTPRPAVRH